MDLLEAAENLLKTLDTITTEDFSHGGEREAREALRKGHTRDSIPKDRDRDGRGIDPEHHSQCESGDPCS